MGSETTVEVRERPILFSSAMVRAILDGRKTQTRRLMKPQPSEDTWGILNRFPHQTGCPYGNVGDRLWIKTGYKTRFDQQFNETHWSIDSMFFTTHGRATSSTTGRNKRDGNHPGMFMPRWLSQELRLPELEIVEVRVQRLQDISEEDAIAEGLIEWTDPPRVPTKHYGLSRADCWETSAVGAFKRIWSDINGPESWNANPWVYAITFNQSEVPHAK